MNNISMTSWDHGLTCLVQADLFSQAEINARPDTAYMRTEQFKKAIHNSLIKCDYPITGVTTHGCRRGGLSSARRDGVEADICMLYGMWKQQCSLLGYDDLLGDRLTRTTEQF